MNGRLTARERLARTEAAQAELLRACDAHRRDYDMRLTKLTDDLAAVKVELARTSTKVAILVGVLCTLGNLVISLLLRHLAR